MLRILSVVLAAASLFTTIVADDSNTTVPFAAFGAEDENIGFALNIPSDSDDLFFTISGPSISSWLAIGMGGSTMKDSLIFMLYASSDKKNVTLSPRLSNGHVEPSHTSNVSISVLDGSGITSDGNMTVNARCSNCRSWKSGSINPKATNQKFIYGVGPDGSINSKSVAASVKAHALYGSFTMDLTKAVGTGGLPDVGALFNSTVGTTQVTDKFYHDLAPAFHACIMIFAFLGMMPMGVLILRVLNRPKWHGFHQTLSACLAIFGAGLGIYIGTMYNRTKKFNSAHQVFGLLIIIALIAQFVLGFMHHHIYVRTQSPTKLAQPHVWLGRVIIPAGIINAFLGFPLTLSPRYNYALAGLVGLVIILILPFIYWKRERFMGSERHKATPEILVESSGYQSRPWATNSTRSDIHLNNLQNQYPPAYDQRYA